MRWHVRQNKAIYAHSFNHKFVISAKKDIIKYLIVILQAYQHVHLKVGTHVCNLSQGVYSNMQQTKKSRSMSRSRELPKKVAKIKSRPELSPKRRERKKIYQSPVSSSDHHQCDKYSYTYRQVFVVTCGQMDRSCYDYRICP